MLPMDPRRARIGKLLTWGSGLAIAALLAPFIFMSIKGLVGLAIAGFLCLVLIHGAPWVAMKAANLGLKAVKAEARANPIESLQQQTLAARERLSKSREDLTNFAAEKRSFEDEVKQLRADQPDDAAEFEQQLQQLNALFDHEKAQIEQAEAEILQAEEATRRAQHKWKVAQSANRISALAGTAKSSAMDKIVADEALDTVRTSMNKALAQMDMATARRANVGATK